LKLKIFTILVFIVLSIPLLSWVLYKPVRVFLPELAGVKCPEKKICIEDIGGLENAKSLYQKAKTYVEENISTFEQLPRYIFCETQSCFEKFGFHKASAQSMGTVATVVGPNGWKLYIIEHEMIHHIQNEKLGSLKVVSMPTWFVEGMAYSFSQDPRESLEEPWESHRKAFNEWYATIAADNFWKEAEKL
jgi:hypothetical protein